MARSERDDGEPPIRDLPPETLRKVRQTVHRRLIESIETDGASILADRGEVRQRISFILNEMRQAHFVRIPPRQQESLTAEIIEELSGSGPLAPLLVDPEVNDILINASDEIWVDRGGNLSRTDIRFDDAAHLRRFLDRTVARQGRHLDAGSPMVDARMADGSRLHAVVPPVSSRGPVVSIRRFRNQSLSIEDLLDTEFLSQSMLGLLSLAVAAKLNIVVSGGAAAGKTTLLNLLSQYIGSGERVVTIEETAELALTHPHVIPLESRPANIEGHGGIDLRQLVRTALRMRADRIIVGEVRGAEVFDMLQAMNVGHDGSLTTVHANTPTDVLSRLEALIRMAEPGLERSAAWQMIGSAIQLIVHLTRFRDGSRRIVSIMEVVRDKNGVPRTQELYRFNISGVSKAGQVSGSHHAAGVMPRLAERIRLHGYDPSPLIADQRKAREERDA